MSSLWSLEEAKKYADRDKVLIAKSGADLQVLADKLDDSGGGILQLLPNTTYTIPTTLTLGDNTILRGAGWSSVITIPDNAPLTEYQLESDRGDHPDGICRVSSIITNKNHTGEANTGIVIENLTIDGNGYNQPAVRGEGETGIWFYNTKECVISNAKVVDVNPLFTRSGFCVLNMNSENTKILGGYFDNASYECIGIRDGTCGFLLQGATIKRARVHSVQIALNWLRKGIGGRDIIIEGCSIDNTGSVGGNGITSHFGSDFVLSNNCIKSNSNCLYVFDGSYRATIVGNKLTSLGGVWPVLFGTPDKPYEDPVEKITFTGNVIQSIKGEYNTFGLWIDEQVKEIIVSSNIINSDGGRGIEIVGATDVIIDGNTITSTGANAIYMRESPSNIIVKNNIVLSAMRGCADDGSTEYVIVEGNDFSAATSSTEKIRINGTNNIIKNNLPMDAENPPVG